MISFSLVLLLIVSNSVLVFLLKKYEGRYRKFQRNEYQGHATALFVPHKKTDLSIYTIANRYTSSLDRLIESAKINKMDISVIGLSHYWRGLTCKMIWLNQYFERQKVPDEQIYLFVDAYDTFITSPQDELLEKFHSFKKDLVFSAEKVCWPDADLADRYPQSVTQMRYLNSGAYMGYVGAFRRAFKTIQPPYQQRDQRMWTQYYLSNLDAIALDYKSRLFLSLTRLNLEESLHKKNQRPFFPDTNQYPCIIHTNGPCKKNYNQVYDHFYPDYQERYVRDLRL